MLLCYSTYHNGCELWKSKKDIEIIIYLEQKKGEKKIHLFIVEV